MFITGRHAKNSTRRTGAKPQGMEDVAKAFLRTGRTADEVMWLTANLEACEAVAAETGDALAIKAEAAQEERRLAPKLASLEAGLLR